MGVNLQKYKEKNEEVQAAAAARGSGGFNFWSPKSGTSNIRLMPPWQDDGEEFEREIWVHWKDKKNYVCPMKTPNPQGGQQDCPICNYVEQLRATDDPADEEIAEKIRAKPRYYVNIIDNEDPTYTQQDVDEHVAAMKDKTKECPFNVGDTKIKVWNFGPMVYEKLLKMFSELQMDLTDLQDGYDILLTKQGTGLNTKYEAMIKPPARAVDVVGKLNLPNLDTFSKPREPQEMFQAIGQAAPSAPTTSLGTAAPAASLPAATPAPAPAAATPAPEDPEDDEEEAAEDDGPPECFKDAEVFSTDDVYCVGGHNDEDGQDYDKCPFYQECGEACGVLKPPAKKRRRKAAKKTAKADDGGDALEAEMAAAMK